MVSLKMVNKIQSSLNDRRRMLNTFFDLLIHFLPSFFFLCLAFYNVPLYRFAVPLFLYQRAIVLYHNG